MSSSEMEAIEVDSPRSSLVVSSKYKSDYPPLPSLASGTPEYSAPLVKAGTPVSLEHVDNAERQYKTRRALQMAQLATMEEVLEAKKREYELLAENANRAAMPDWVSSLQQQIQSSMQQQLEDLQEKQLQQIQQSNGGTGIVAFTDDTNRVETSELLRQFQNQLQEHSQNVSYQVSNVTYQINEIGQTLLQENVRNMNRIKVKHETDALYSLPIMEPTLDDDLTKAGSAKVVYPKDRGLWFPGRLCQIKKLPQGVKYPNYPPGTEYQIDQLLKFYEINVSSLVSELKELEISENTMSKEILRYKQEALYHFLGVEWC